MKKKVLIIISIVLFILFILGLITSYKDNARVRVGIEPIYVFKIVNDKELKITYIGLGYKVIRYVDVNLYGHFGENDSFKYGNWFMKYENPYNEENNEKIKEVFKGKVIENNNDRIKVEVLDDCNSLKKGEEVMVKVLNYKTLNIQYEKDMILTISFNGLIEESDPPQILSSNISLDINDYNK